ncbi:IS21-like element helper ATPase IstB [Desulfobotulus sp. H1]|uniref:IS21-like element helper ATPase IstB n=1 Tax=Desulfobotulus pelophilus TaxID=2823377 RepID=A0ABT3NDB3_9BACT|nr:IS21-like element helper ATPase IstB [Desulfobotulus pelophilus]MCW7755459.1 IS21-like element helper ATPase IstB [Desulfobotulus pelophilus]
MTARARTEVDSIRSTLVDLGLNFAAENLTELLSESVRRQMPGHEFLGRLLETEIAQREERRIERTLRLSGLPVGYTLGNFDFAFQPAIDKARIETLATSAYIRQNETILIQGPPGTGKTHLAVALGVKGIEHGFSVAFYTLESLIHAARQHADRPLQRMKSVKYLKSSLLIIDEMGFQPLSREEASLLFRVINYRYGRGSIIITTNKAVKDWPEILAGDEVMTTAVLDRLLHKSHVLHIKGRSYRLKDLEKMLAGPHPSAPP